MTYVINFTTDFENLTTQKVISTKLLTLSNNNYFLYIYIYSSGSDSLEVLL